MEFKEWLERKFLEWRGDRIQGASVSEFARELGISQPLVADWLNGRKKPGTRTIPKLAAKYPDVYHALGLTPPAAQIPLENLPSDLRQSLQTAIDEATRQIQAQNLNPGSPQAENLVIAIFEKHGFTYQKTKNVNL